MSIIGRITEKSKEAKARQAGPPLRIRIAVLLVLLVGGGFWYFAANAANGLTLKGTVETTMYSHTAEVAGMVKEAPIELGGAVTKGDILFVIDDSDQKYAITQLEQTLIQRKAALALLQKGADAAEIKTSSNQVAVARAAYEKALEDYTATKALYEAGAVSKTALDSAEYQYNVTKSQFDSAKQQLSLTTDGADEETIVSAEAQVAQTESQLAQMKEDLEKYTIRANCNGILMSKNYLAGDMVSAGYNLGDVAASEENYVLAYVPEDDIELVEYGGNVTIRTDDGDFTGLVAYIDVESEYTPKDMQTSANKNKDSFKIKVKISAGVPLKPGEETKILIER